MKPTTSVIVVSTTEPDIAGSAPIDFSTPGSTAPASAAISKLIMRAEAMMPPSNMSSNTMVAAAATIAAHTNPLIAPTASSLLISQI